MKEKTSLIKLEKRNHGNYEIVQFFLIGSVGISATKEIGKILDAALKDGQTRFIFNLTGASEVDAAGLGGLITCKRKIENIGGVALTVNKPGFVNNILKATALDRQLNKFMSLEEAINFFSSK